MKTNLVRVSKYSNKIFELPPWKRIAADYPLLSRDIVAAKLAKVAERLPPSLSLQIDSAYRDINIQKIIWKLRTDPRKDDYLKTKSIVTDPSIGVSSHTTGGAVDVSLLDRNGKEINLSSPYKKYYDEPQLYSKKISKRAQKLRLLIYKLMLGEKFAPNPKEYWHFSYGGTSWAKYYHTKKIFDEIPLDRRIYYNLFVRIIFRITRYYCRLARFLTGKQTNY